MNRSKKLIALLGVLAVACLATLGVMRMEERKEEIRTSEDVILEIDADSVQSLSWEYESNTLAFHKEEHWLYDADAAFPVSGEKIGELLAPFEAFGVSFTIENVEDYGQYGLDAPMCTIELTAGDETYQIELGDFSTMDAKRYVSIGDGNVYLVQNDPLDFFDVELSGLIENDRAPSFESVSAVSFTGGENYEIFHEENSTASYSDDDVYFTEHGGQTVPLDPFRVENYLRTVSTLDLTDYVSYSATETELADCGLDAPDLTVTINGTVKDENGDPQEETFVLHISRDPAEKAKADAADGESADAADTDTAETEAVTAYARVGDSQIIYRLSAESCKTLTAAGYDDLRHSEVLWADFADISGLDIALEGEAYTITSEKSGDARTWSYADKALDTADLQAALEALTAERFTDEAAADREEIGLTVHLDNENIQAVSVQLYRYDSAQCLAVVDGQPVSLVPRAAVVDLIECIHALVWE